MEKFAQVWSIIEGRLNTFMMRDESTVGLRAPKKVAKQRLPPIRDQITEKVARRRCRSKLIKGTFLAEIEEKLDKFMCDDPEAKERALKLTTKQLLHTALVEAHNAENIERAHRVARAGTTSRSLRKLKSATCDSYLGGVESVGSLYNQQRRAIRESIPSIVVGPLRSVLPMPKDIRHCHSRQEPGDQPELAGKAWFWASLQGEGVDEEENVAVQALSPSTALPLLFWGSQGVSSESMQGNLLDYGYEDDESDEEECDDSSLPAPMLSIRSKTLKSSSILGRSARHLVSRSKSSSSLVSMDDDEVEGRARATESDEFSIATSDLQQLAKEKQNTQESDMTRLTVLSRQLEMLGEQRNFRSVERQFAMQEAEEELAPQYNLAAGDRPRHRDPYLHILPYGFGSDRRFLTKRPVLEEEAEHMETIVEALGCSEASSAIDTETGGVVGALREDGGETLGDVRDELENADSTALESKWRTIDDALLDCERLGVSRSLMLEDVEDQEKMEKIQMSSQERGEVLGGQEAAQKAALDALLQTEDACRRTVENVRGEIRELREEMALLRRNSYSIEISQAFQHSEECLKAVLPLLGALNPMTDVRRQSDVGQLSRLQSDVDAASQRILYGQHDLPNLVSDIVRRFHRESAQKRQDLGQKLSRLLGQMSRLQRPGERDRQEEIRVLGAEIEALQTCEALFLELSHDEEVAIEKSLSFWRPRHSQALAACSLAKLSAEGFLYVRQPK